MVAGDIDLLELPESVTGRRISYASSDAFLPQGTLRDNLLYGLQACAAQHPDLRRRPGDPRSWEVLEAKLAGNPDLRRQQRLDRLRGRPARTVRRSCLPSIRHVLEAVILSRDILDLGAALGGRAGRATAELVERVVELRAALRERLEKEGATDLVVPFEPGAYNREATVRENLFSARPPVPSSPTRRSRPTPISPRCSSKLGLDEILYGMGLEIAEQAIELFSDLPPDHPFFQQLAFMTPEELPTYDALLQKLKGRPFDSVSEEDRAPIITLSFAYIEPRHRFGLLTEELMDKVVEARTLFYEHLPEELKGAIEPYDPERYTTTASVMDNVLFGRIAHSQPDGPERIRTIVCQILDDLNLYDDVLDVGLGFNVGVGGRRLTAAQRQKLDVARALLKRPDYLIFNRPLSALDQRLQDQILRNVLEEAHRDGRMPAVIWVLTNPAMAQYFDRVVVFDGGELVDDGSHETLLERNGIFKAMLA